jgi:hypothetical protein
MFPSTMKIPAPPKSYLMSWNRQLMGTKYELTV